MNAQLPNLIHVGRLFDGRGRRCYAMLRKEDGVYRWYREAPGGREEPTPLQAKSESEAMTAAARFWKDSAFEPVHCGFRYDSQVRDEHGINAQFWEMVLSYSASNIDGSYLDPEAGHLCYVDFCSEEARQLWQRLKAQNRL